MPVKFVMQENIKSRNLLKMQECVATVPVESLELMTEVHVHPVASANIFLKRVRVINRSVLTALGDFILLPWHLSHAFLVHKEDMAMRSLMVKSL